MPQFYTVDRRNTLTAGSTLELARYRDVTPPELQRHVDAMFPEGLSCHGEQYFLRNSSLARVATPAIELLFEYVRRAEFRDKPSRFQSWFAVAAVHEATEFRTRYGAGSGRIWRVEPNAFLRVNMALLSLGGSILVRSWLAHTYWRGESGPGLPIWEYLLVPPIRVVEAVEESNAANMEQNGA